VISVQVNMEALGVSEKDAHGAKPIHIIQNVSSEKQYTLIEVKRLIGRLQRAVDLVEKEQQE
jgi:hypothetical protein